MRLTTSGTARNFVDEIVGRVTTKKPAALSSRTLYSFIHRRRLPNNRSGWVPRAAFSRRSDDGPSSRSIGCESLTILGMMMSWFWRRAVVSCALFIDHLNATTHCSLRSAVVVTA